MKKRIKSHKDLEVFNEAFEIAMQIFHLTKEFPGEEKYGLTNQIRRSSRSVCLNLGEAWRKRRYPAAFISKLSDCEAEACETQIGLKIGHACGYLTEQKYQEWHDRYEKIIGMIVQMMRYPEKWKV